MKKTPSLAVLIAKISSPERRSAATPRGFGPAASSPGRAEPRRILRGSHTQLMGVTIGRRRFRTPSGDAAKIHGRSCTERSQTTGTAPDGRRGFLPLTRPTRSPWRSTWLCSSCRPSPWRPGAPLRQQSVMLAGEKADEAKSTAASSQAGQDVVRLSAAGPRLSSQSRTLADLPHTGMLPLTLSCSARFLSVCSDRSSCSLLSRSGGLLLHVHRRDQQLPGRERKAG